MTEDELIKRYPHLFHMAEDGSWPSIKQHGLLSTSALLTLYGYTGDRRHQLESAHRPKKIPIQCEGLEDAVLRDQIPMPPEALTRCLIDGMTPEEWYKLINGKIFFWTTWRSLEMFLAAKEYKNYPQVVVTIDTARLMKRHTGQVTLSSINSGSTYYDPSKYAGPPPRGKGTFKKIENYYLDYIAELVVEEGIKDVTGLATSVDRWIAHRTNYEKARFERLEHLWH